MRYVSTRNTKQDFSFEEVFLKGLAADGGLYIPKKIPSYSLEDLENLKKARETDAFGEQFLRFLLPATDEAKGA